MTKFIFSHRMCLAWSVVCLLAMFRMQAGASDTEYSYLVPDFPDPLLVETYKQAADKNIIACVNPAVFPGYWCVCADGQGYGYGCSYPSLDGLQIADALVRLGGYETLKLNWDYVRSFQRADGFLPFAILPSSAGHTLNIFGYPAPVDKNGGLYTHWAPGGPLSVLTPQTYIAQATIIYAVGQDKKWLDDQIASINLAANYLVSLVNDDGRVRGAGYYVERPPRIESDGVSQCYAVDAFRQVSQLNAILGRKDDAARYQKMADKIQRYFVTKFWHKDKFAEYYNPEHGFITTHGLTDTDWASIALRVATKEQVAVLYPQLVKAKDEFAYGTMPAGIATKPDTYEDWESFPNTPRHDLAAMGRAWYLTAMANANMHDATHLVAWLRAVAEEGKRHDYSWRERYYPSSDGENHPEGAYTYCEYPANFVRIVQRFLLGVDLRLDGSIVLAPTVPDEYWEKGFGQEIRLPKRTLTYHCQSHLIKGTWQGEQSQSLGVCLDASPTNGRQYTVIVDGNTVASKMQGEFLFFALPKSERAVEWEVKLTERKLRWR